MKLKEVLLSKSNLIRSSGISLSSQLFILVAGIVSGIITARVLGPAGRGAYALIIFASNIIAILLSFGVPKFTACHVSESLTQNRVARNSLQVALLGSCIVLAAAISLTMFRSSETFGIHELTFLGIAVIAIPRIFALHTQAFLQGLDRIMLFSVARVIGPFIELILLILFMVILGLGLKAALGVKCLSFIAIASIGFVYLRRFYTGLFHIDGKLLRRSLRFGGFALASQIVGTLNQRFDLIIVGIFLGRTDTGIYSVAIATSFMLWHLPIAVATALLPKITPISKSEACLLTARAVRVVLCMSIGLALMGFFTAGIIPLVYGTSYSAVIPIFKLLLPGSALYSIVCILGAYFDGVLKKPELNGMLAGLSLLLDLSLNALLIPKYGLRGVAIACSISYGITSLAALALFSKKANIGIGKLIIPRVDDLTTIRRIVLTAIKR